MRRRARTEWGREWPVHSPVISFHPESDSSFPPSRQYDAAAPDGSFPPSRAARPQKEFKGSFGRAATHFWDATERMGKHVAAMLALVAAVLTTLAVGLAYWTALQGFVKEPVTNQLRADLRAAEFEIKVLQTTLASVQQGKQSADDKLYHQGEDIAALKKALESKRGK